MSNIFVTKPFQREFKTSYNEETGVSTVTYVNEFGRFTGTAKLHPQDTKSNFIGYHIAESRADIEYYRVLYNYWYGRLVGLDHFMSDFYSKFEGIPEIDSIYDGVHKQTVTELRKAEYKLKREKEYLKEYLDKIEQSSK